MEVKPRQGVSKYSETHTFDVYDIMRQLNDSRFRGRHGLGTIPCDKNRGDDSRRPICAPRFRPEVISKTFQHGGRWRPDTSNIHHAMTAGSEEQKFVFSANPEFDRLRIDAANNNKPVEVQGIIAGFDGPYPIVSVKKYEVGYHLKKDAPERETAGKPTYDYLERR